MRQFCSYEQLYDGNLRISRESLPYCKFKNTCYVGSLKGTKLMDTIISRGIVQERRINNSNDLEWNTFFCLFSWQMCIISVRTYKWHCLYFCVEQQQHCTLLEWHTINYFVLFDQVSQIMWDVMLTTYPLLVPRLRKSKSYTSSHAKRLHGV
jgi:hypothetical protein